MPLLACMTAHTETAAPHLDELQLRKQVGHEQKQLECFIFAHIEETISSKQSKHLWQS